MANAHANAHAHIYGICVRWLEARPKGRGLEEAL